MRSAKFFRVFGVVMWALAFFAGCSSSGGGDSDPDPAYEIYTAHGSDLVLSIPGGLDVPWEDIKRIHSQADDVPHCYTTNRDPVDIVLAEACVYYDYLYLFPQYFPQGLDSIKTVASYVSYLQTRDPFTFYMSPEEFVHVLSFFQGESALIGITIDCDGPTVSDRTPLVITDVVPFTRAWVDGFKPGDSIVGIDGVSINGMGLEAVELLFPTREEEPVDITVDRDEVEITISTAAEENIALILYGDIAYLSIRSFTETTGEEVRQDFEQLQAEAGGTVDKLILDLRDNGGGSVSGALALVDYLVDRDTGGNPVMTIRGPSYETETRYLGAYSETNIGDFDETSFVLLIDGNSASASEIVASVLKHYGTATLMGATTFGKGIGQSVVNLIDGSGVLVPSFESLPPSGVSYHRVGLSPDYRLNAAVSAFDDDPVLDAAVQYLNTGSVPAAAFGNILRNHGVAVSGAITDPLREALMKRNGSGRYY